MWHTHFAVMNDDPGTTALKRAARGGFLLIPGVRFNHRCLSDSIAKNPDATGCNRFGDAEAETASEWLRSLGFVGDQRIWPLRKKCERTLVSATQATGTCPI